LLSAASEACCGIPAKQYRRDVWQYHPYYIAHDTVISSLDFYQYDDPSVHFLARVILTLRNTAVP